MKSYVDFIDHNYASLETEHCTYSVEWDEFSGEILFGTLCAHSDSHCGDSHTLLFPLGIVNFDFGKGRDQRLYMGTSRDGLSGGTLVF
ncbi:hypothetical protein QR676_08205 [Vibrio sp. TMPB1044]|uniref:hypothetical protein n=1 Tax=Vibrio sp. TMPB1044 TaxID=3051822 RepID=UPI00255C1CFC|nr:hypothetical protein [Vibrio sp. TMPB1044]MDL5027207.1 hypothetical protein [Vibrio sp. TMPB1044]MDN5207335.1 hypothetical protein [Vibrio sp. TMPB1044]